MAKRIEVDLRQFSYREKTILRDIRFSVDQGEFLVLTGLSGCGKTSLLRMMNGFVPTLYEGTYTGEIRIFGKPLAMYAKGGLARYIGNVFQNPNDQFFAREVEREVALIGENMGMERTRLHQRVRQSLEDMGIETLRKKNVRVLSGGQKQKVAIASTRVFESEILFFDEPSANLDAHATRELKEVLAKLKHDGKTIVIAEHRISYLAKLMDRLLILKDGTLDAIVPSERLDDDFLRTHNLRCLHYDHLRSVVPPPGDEAQIRVEDVAIANKSYHRDMGVSFSLRRGECMALIGANGIGKTTLAKELAGLIPMKTGTTSYGNTTRERLSRVSISLQNCSNMFFYETVERELIPRSKMKDRDYLAKVKSHLIELELWDKRLLNPHDLSGGEKQRLALLIALMEDAELTILDEPTAGLDDRRMTLVSRAIRRKTEETPVLLITHDPELLIRTCNTAYFLLPDGGKKIDVAGNEAEIVAFLREEQMRSV